MYFCTLSVENCGAIGMPMTRVTPAAASRASASLMNGCQLRMPTATGIVGAEPRAQRRRLRLGNLSRAASARRWRRSSARISCDELVRRRTPAAHQLQILRHLVQRGRGAVGHQQDADAT